MSADYAANHPKCPPFIANIISKGVFYISRLNPNGAAAPATATSDNSSS